MHKQVASEPLLDVITEEGQHLSGLPAGECCLQVRGAPPVPPPRCHLCRVGWPVARSVGWVWRGSLTHLRRLPNPLPLPLLRHCLLPPQNERDDTVDDLVKSDFLHEPGCAVVVGWA